MVAEESVAVTTVVSADGSVVVTVMETVEAHSAVEETERGGKRGRKEVSGGESAAVAPTPRPNRGTKRRVESEESSGGSSSNKARVTSDTAVLTAFAYDERGLDGTDVVPATVRE